MSDSGGISEGQISSGGRSSASYPSASPFFSIIAVLKNASHGVSGTNAWITFRLPKSLGIVIEK
ncbi:hypothetical protein CR513_21938, partial [Mucuna pruriens]